MYKSRENFELVFIIQLFMIVLKIFDCIILSWSIILIPVEAFIAVILLSVLLYLLGIMLKVGSCILKSINEGIKKRINNISIKNEKKQES